MSNIDKQKLYDFLFMYQEHMNNVDSHGDKVEVQMIQFKKDELDYVMDLVANDIDIDKPFIHDPEEKIDLPPGLIKDLIKATRPYWKPLHMTKDEAVTFAKKYLTDRRVIQHGFSIATEYTLLDIIPYIYGDALD